MQRNRIQLGNSFFLFSPLRGEERGRRRRRRGGGGAMDDEGPLELDRVMRCQVSLAGMHLTSKI